VELQVQRAVDPGDPDQGEDDGELGQPAERDVLGQVVGGLADEGHIHQVVQQLQVADLPVGDDLAVGSWRPPEPALEAAVGLARHGISRPPPTMRAGCSAAASVRCRPWRCWVIGGHGQVGLRLLRLLARDGHRGRGVIRKAEQAGDLAAADAEAVLSDHPLLMWT
jgi:hypothetical protein